MTPDRDGGRSSSSLSVIGLSLALVALAGLLWWLVLEPVPDWQPRVLLTVAVLTVAFGLAETLVLHVDIGDFAHSANLVEIPLVLALFWLPPELVVVTRVLGALVALWLRRRQSGTKLLFNGCMMTLEATVAVTVFQALGATVGTDPALQVWAVAAASAVASSLTASSAVLVVIAVAAGGRVPTRSVRRVLLGAGPTAVVAAGVGFLAVQAVHADVTAAVPLVLVGTALALVHGSHVRLLKEHERMASLYGFVRQISCLKVDEAPVLSVLNQTRATLKCEVVVLTRLLEHPTAGSAQVVRHQLDADGALVVSEHALTAQAGLQLHCLRTQTSVLLPRGTRDGEARALLHDEDVRDGILVALPGQHGGLNGTLFVGGRRGEHSTFEPADVAALEGLAGHAAMALHNGWLLERLTHESRHDALTGLPNRTEFQARLAAVLAESRSTAVLFMDLDRFKDVNDALGHHAGDTLLSQVAARLTGALPDGTTVARLGGDEFGVALLDHDPAAAMAVARRLRTLLQKPVSLDGLSVDVGASIGVALAPQHGTEAGLLMRRADIAMYEAKEHDGVALFDAQQDEPTAGRLTMVAQLRHSLSCDQLLLHYQPQVCAQTGQTVRVEALLRWMHPQRGLVPPDEFIPVAERAGLLQDITTWVLRRSLDDLSTWRRAGHDLGVSINLSPRNLLDPTLADTVRHELSARGLPADCLTLEITEGTIMAEPERAVEVLTGLRETGVRLSIDDFGTGYSSLSYLKLLPVDEVKLDRSFIKGLAEDPTDVAIVRAVVALADSLRLEVVAEGVEDEASQSLLRALGCRYLQGYLLSRPMAEPALLPWLSDSAGRPWVTHRRLEIAPVPAARGAGRDATA